MTVNETVFQLAVLFLPGVIAAGIVDLLTVHKVRTAFEITLRAFVFGIGCYIVYFFVLWASSGTLPPMAAWNGPPSLAEMQQIHVGDIAGSLVVSVLLGILWSGSVNHSFFLRFMQTLRITKKFGDQDVWDFTLNLKIPNVEYTYVRDFEKKVVYSGWVKAFSDGTTRRELLMENVEVFDLDTAERLFETPLMYASFSNDSFNMEFPYRGSSRRVQR